MGEEDDELPVSNRSPMRADAWVQQARHAPNTIISRAQVRCEAQLGHSDHDQPQCAWPSAVSTHKVEMPATAHGYAALVGTTSPPGHVCALGAVAWWGCAHPWTNIIYLRGTRRAIRKKHNVIRRNGRQAKHTACNVQCAANAAVLYYSQVQRAPVARSIHAIKQTVHILSDQAHNTCCWQPHAACRLDVRQRHGAPRPSARTRRTCGTRLPCPGAAALATHLTHHART